MKFLCLMPINGSCSFTNLVNIDLFSCLSLAVQAFFLYSPSDSWTVCELSHLGLFRHPTPEGGFSYYCIHVNICLRFTHPYPTYKKQVLLYCVHFTFRHLVLHLGGCNFPGIPGDKFPGNSRLRSSNYYALFIFVYL